MTNEEFEKQKDFILNQQAQFSSDIIELKSGLAELRDIVTRLANATLNRLEDTDQRFSALVDSQMRQSSAAEEMNQRFAALLDSQIRLQETQIRTSEETKQNFAALIDSQAKLSEAQGRTDENLRNLIAVVDRTLQGRNGGSTA
jgi:hypothetical protein